MSLEYYKIPREQLDKIEEMVELLDEEGIHTVPLFIFEAIENFIDTQKTINREKLYKEGME